MADMEKINDQELDQVAGGAGAGNVWVTVGRLQSGYLALRTAPCYDYNNEIRGSESYNGQTLQITGSYVPGSDGKTYVWVFNPRSGKSGYVNSYYLVY